MGDETKTLEELVRAVPLEYQSQLRGYVECLLAQASAGQPGEPQFAWAGALEDLRDRYTSVDLQHQIARWRTDGQ
jgi:hypothetical protein